MSKRKFTVGSRWVLVSSWLGLLVYGCVAAPADDLDDGRLGTGGGVSGSAGAGVSGSTSGSAGTVSGSAGVGVGGTPPATGGTPGTGGTPPATGGSVTGGAGSGVGGTVAGSSGVAGTPTGGTAGTPAAGSGPGGAGSSAGGSGSVNVDPACEGISSNMPCTPQGQACPNLACGLGDTGRRDCNCATNWMCLGCSYANSPIMTKPANADTPCVGVTEMAACAMGNDPASVCASTAVAGEYCICAINPKTPTEIEWDCDDPPSVWPP